MSAYGSAEGCLLHQDTQRVLQKVSSAPVDNFQNLIIGKNMQLSDTIRVALQRRLMELEVRDEVRTAANAAWTVYLATHRDVDARDGRRCLLERHLQGRSEARHSNAEELTCSGLTYLERFPKDEW